MDEQSSQDALQDRGGQKKKPVELFYELTKSPALFILYHGIL